MKHLVVVCISIAIVASGCASKSDAAPAESADLGTISTHGHGSGTHDTTTHTPSDPEDQAAHEKDCAAGTMSGCHAAALDHYYSPATPEHDAAALRFFTRGCDGGYAASCNGLGVLYGEGRGVAKDEVQAEKLYRASCDADGSTGCEHLALALESGRGVAKDQAVADLARARGRCLFAQSIHAPDAGACAPLPAA
ncbi:hypothetical protein BH09MYX1_BH09MYX1_16310 [soil metagenome]